MTAAATYDALDVGTAAPPLVVENLTRTNFVRYAGASGDFNPMHHDDTIATQVGNPSVFGHGMLTAGLMARVVKDWFGPEAMRRFQVRFAKQVWPGDTLTFTATVTGKREEGGERLVDLELAVTNQDGVEVAHRHRDRRRRLSADMGLLDGRVAVVTGSGRGIGREFALCLASEGAKVVVNDVGVSPRRAGHRRGPGGAGVQGDRGARRRRRCPTTTRSPTSTAPRGSSTPPSTSFGKIDILVNNAGIVRDRTLVKMDEADFDAVVAVHLKGSFNCARHAAPIMKDAGLRPHHQHHVVGRPARQLRPDELRRGQGRASWA